MVGRIRNALLLFSLMLLNLVLIEGLANPYRIKANAPSEFDNGNLSSADHITYGSLGDSDELRDLLTVKQSSWR